MGGIELISCPQSSLQGIMRDEMLKKARTGFVCTLTACFAFIAMMGEGLHFLPGMGHSCCHTLDCLDYCHFCAEPDGPSLPCSQTVSHSGHNTGAVGNAAVCPVCMFLSLAKMCLPAESAASECAPIVHRLAVCSPLLQSRFFGSYLSRAPPCDLPQM